MQFWIDSLDVFLYLETEAILMQCNRIPDVSLTFCCLKEIFILIVIPLVGFSMFCCSLIYRLTVLVLE